MEWTVTQHSHSPSSYSTLDSLSGATLHEMANPCEKDALLSIFATPTKN